MGEYVSPGGGGAVVLVTVVVDNPKIKFSTAVPIESGKTGVSTCKNVALVVPEDELDEKLPEGTPLLFDANDKDSTPSVAFNVAEARAALELVPPPTLSCDRVLIVTARHPSSIMIPVLSGEEVVLNAVTAANTRFVRFVRELKVFAPVGSDCPLALARRNPLNVLDTSNVENGLVEFRRSVVAWFTAAITCSGSAAWVTLRKGESAVVFHANPTPPSSSATTR